MDASIIAAMVLQNLPETGAVRCCRLLQVFQDAETAIRQPVSVLRPYLSAAAIECLSEYQTSKDQSSLGKKIAKDSLWLDKNNVSVITSANQAYPQLLKHIYQPPPLLYVLGDISRLNFPQIAIVGTRSPTPTGTEIAHEFSRYLAGMGFDITSGLALGIDSAAHRGAIAAGASTLAVLGTGIDKVYPRRNKKLAEQIIAEGGALISEFPLGCDPRPAHFPQRNRVISGLSLGVLVVEAAIKSGSLITARFALQQSREVFAVPGSVYNPVSRGCHLLISEGATLVEKAQDIVDQLQGGLAFKCEEIASHAKEVNTMLENNTAIDLTALSDEEKKLISCLSYEAVSVDTLVLRSGFDVGTVMATVVNLELMGLVSHSEEGYLKTKGQG